jgi:hypothetical protein
MRNRIRVKQGNGRMSVALGESQMRFAFLFRLAQPNPALAGFQLMHRLKRLELKPEPVLR